jgi:hypothetical protein
MTSGTVDVGPGLGEIIAAQRDDDAAVRYPQLAEHARALAELSRDLDDPLVWPIGIAAERLAGAAVVLSAGEVRTRGWNTDVTAQRVLLLAVTAVTSMSLVEAARHARELGAEEIYACGIRVQGLEADHVPDEIHEFITLG